MGVVSRAVQAEVLHGAGEREKAAGLFADAERRQRALDPQTPVLYSEQGYHYCDLLLSQGHAAEASIRATQTLEIARRNHWLIDIALDTLTLGRANFALALRSLASGPSVELAGDHACAAAARLDGALEGLRASGRNDYVPRGLLARAALRRAVGDWDGAKRDLDEAKEIAESGLMRLYWCDCALEGARLALARGLRAAQRPRRAEPTTTRSARRHRGGCAQRGSAEGARRRAQAHRRMRLPSSRRGVGRARRRRRRRPPLRRPAASRLRRVIAIAVVWSSFRPAVGANVSSQILGSGSRRVSDPAVA
jgi:hypothetical protein